MCRFCEEDVETFIHFATDCPARWRERRDHLQVYIGDQFMAWTPKQLLDFAYSLQIRRLLEMKHDEEEDEDEESAEDRVDDEMVVDRQ